MNPISSTGAGMQQLNNHPLLRPPQKTAEPPSRTTAPPTTDVTTEAIQTNPRASVSTKPNSQLPDFLARKVQDIQNVASQVGYVDLSEGAIVQAMRENRSLLIDYRA